MKMIEVGGAAAVQSQIANRGSTELAEVKSQIPPEGFGDLQFHPIALCVPALPEAEMAELVERIRLRGASDPFVKRGEMILDDPNRVRACQRAGVELTYHEWDGSGSLAMTIARAILPRTHLSQCQRATIAVFISDQLSGETIPVRQGNLLRTGRRGSQHWGRNGAEKGGAATSRNGELQNQKTAFLAKSTETAQVQFRQMSDSCDSAKPGKSAESESKAAAKMAADVCGCSERAVYQARALRDANRDLFDQVRMGLLNLSRARLEASKLVRAKSLGNQTKPAKATGGGKDSDELIVGDCLMVMSAMLARPSTGLRAGPAGKAAAGGAGQGVAGGFDLIFADPPYNLGWKYDSDPTADQLPEDGYLEWTEKWMGRCARLLSPTGSMFVMISGRWQGRFDAILRRTEARLFHRSTIVWHDPFPNHTDANFQPAARFIHYFARHPKQFTFNADSVRVPSRRDEIGDARRTHEKGVVPHDVWDIPRIVGNSPERVPFDDCPPQVPAAILRRIILAASNPGDRVFDPFTGNGTTWRACRELGRSFTGIERSAKYAAQARQWATSGKC